MTKFAAWVGVAGAMLCITYGHVVMKWRMQGRLMPDALGDKILFLLRALFEPWVLSAVALTFVGSLMWMAAMTRLPLSQAFPFTGVPFVLVTLFSIALFNEAATAPRLIGVAMIVCGIALAARG